MSAIHVAAVPMPINVGIGIRIRIRIGMASGFDFDATLPPNTLPLEYPIPERSR